MEVCLACQQRAGYRQLTEGLGAAELSDEDLAGLKGSDSRKFVLATLLWQRTVVPQEWFAEKLWMRSAANVSQQFRRMDDGMVEATVPVAMRV